MVNARNTSNECPKCDHVGLEEAGYRRLKCPKCGFEGDRDEVGKLNVRKRALKILGLNGGALTPQQLPPNDRCKPKSTGEPPSPKRGPSPPSRAGRRSA